MVIYQKHIKWTLIPILKRYLTTKEMNRMVFESCSWRWYIKEYPELDRSGIIIKMAESCNIISPQNKSI